MRYNHNLSRVISGEMSPNDSALALFDESDDFGDLFCLRQFFLHRFNRLPGVVFRSINHAKSFFDQLHAFGWIIFPLQADQIDSANFGGVTVGDHEWWNVLDNFRATAGDGEPADPAKLMHGGEPANDGVIAHLHVAGQRAVVGENDSISNRAIVADMTVGEKRATIADARFPLARRAPTDCDEFAKCVFIADFQISRFAVIF